MAKDYLSSRSVSCLRKWDSLEPMVFRACNQPKTAELMEFSCPMGAPKRVAFSGFTLHKSGTACSNRRPAESSQMSSVFEWFKDRPKWAAWHSMYCRSCNTSFLGPLIVHHVRGVMIGWMVRQKRNEGKE